MSRQLFDNSEMILRVHSGAINALTVGAEFAWHWKDSTGSYEIIRLKPQNPLYISGSKQLDCRIFGQFDQVINSSELYQVISYALTNMDIFLAAEQVRHARMAYLDPTKDEATCYYDLCHRKFRGPAVYCSLGCALADGNK